MVTRLGWVLLCRKMLIMGLTKEEAAKRKKEREYKEKKKKAKERKAVMAFLYRFSNRSLRPGRQKELKKQSH